MLFKWGNTFSRETLTTAFFAISWFVLNVTIGTVNKAVYYFHDFHYPVFLTFFHMVSCFALGWFFRNFVFARDAPPKPVSPSKRKKILLLSVIFCVSVAAGNTALTYIFVSFAQMIGATTPMFTVALASLTGHKRYNVWVYISTIPMAIGVCMCTKGEVNFHVVGFLFLLLATITRAMKSIVGAVLLKGESEDEKMDSFSLLYHMAQPSAVMLFIYCCIVEYDVFWDPKLLDFSTMLLVFISGCVAFFLNVTNFLVTFHTSAVTLQVLGNIKVVMSIIVSVLVFGNEISSLSGIGCTLAMGGVYFYNKASKWNVQEIKKKEIREGEGEKI